MMQPNKHVPVPDAESISNEVKTQNKAQFFDAFSYYTQTIQRSQPGQQNTTCSIHKIEPVAVHAVFTDFSANMT